MWLQRWLSTPYLNNIVFLVCTNSHHYNCMYLIRDSNSYYIRTFVRNFFFNTSEDHTSKLFLTFYLGMLYMSTMEIHMWNTQCITLRNWWPSLQYWLTLWHHMICTHSLSPLLSSCFIKWKSIELNPPFLISLLVTAHCITPLWHGV